MNIDDSRTQVRGRPAILILLASAIGFISGVFFTSLLTGRCEPASARLLRTEPEVFKRYAEAVVAGRVTERADQQGYVLPDELRRLGISYARREGTCAVLTLEGLPPDALHQLIYAPNGYRSVTTQSPEGTNRVIEFRDLGGGWWFRALY